MSAFPAINSATRVLASGDHAPIQRLEGHRTQRESIDALEDDVVVLLPFLEAIGPRREGFCRRVRITHILIGLPAQDIGLCEHAGRDRLVLLEHDGCRVLAIHTRVDEADRRIDETCNISVELLVGRPLEGECDVIRLDRRTVLAGLARLDLEGELGASLVPLVALRRGRAELRLLR